MGAILKNKYSLFICNFNFNIYYNQLSIKRYFRYVKIILKIKIILIIIISSFISNKIIKYSNKRYENLYKNIEEIETIGIVISNKVEKEYKNRYKIKVIQNQYKNTILYIDTNKNIELKCGDKVQVKGKFQEPDISRNYKGFNYKEYLKTKKVYGTIKVENIKIQEENCGNVVINLSNKIFTKIKSNIEKTYNETTSKIILGVMLGYTENIEEDTKEEFSKSNISHVLAVSGMHISYIIYLVTNSTEKIIGKRKSKVITSIILIIYMFITGFSISVVRATIMGVLNCMSFVFYRKNNTLNSIAISVLVILINNPFSIIDNSFLFTYGGTLGIIFFKDTIERMLKNVKVKNRKWKYIFIKIQRKSQTIIEIISVSISAQIIIMPIMIFKFNTLNVSFLLTNILLYIVIGIIVMGGFIQIVITFFSTKIGVAIARIIELPTYGLILISKINFGNFIIVTPYLIQIIFFYISVFSIRYLYNLFHSKNITITQLRINNTIHLVKYKIKPHRNKIVYLVIILAIVYVIIGTIPHDLKIHFIDVGQGDSTLILTPNDKKILIDGGGSATYDVGKNVLLPYLLNRRINKLDYIIISHFDLDHVNSLFTIIDKIKVKNIIICKQPEISENYKKLLSATKEKNIKIIKVNKGDKIKIQKDLEFNILWPDENKFISENALNNNSLVCKMNYKKFSMLFTGDIEEIAEKDILKYYKNDLNSTILKVAHHGSKTSSIEKILEEINPKIAVIGVGKDNTFGHPSNEVIKRLKKLNIDIYRTDLNGEITITTNGNKYKINKKI